MLLHECIIKVWPERQDLTEQEIISVGKAIETLDLAAIISGRVLEVAGIHVKVDVVE